jgi:DNA-binding transcriptional LysR family regulator
LLASLRDGLEAVGALQRAERGTLTLAVVGTLASTALTERLRRSREAYPDVRLTSALR